MTTTQDWDKTENQDTPGSPNTHPSLPNEKGSEREDENPGEEDETETTTPDEMDEDDKVDADEADKENAGKEKDEFDGPGKD